MRTGLTTLSRWRHGFESRWGCYYHDLGLSVVDASVVAIAERLGASTIASITY
jgi:hypothetical protein